MSEEDKEKMKIYMKKQKKYYSNNVLRKIKENNELKNVEVDLLTTFIKGEVERFSDAEVYNDDVYDSEKDKVTVFR